MIVRSAELKLVVQSLEDARLSMDRILKLYKGYVGQLTVTDETGSVPSLAASLRIPNDQLDPCLDELRRLGRVTVESLQGEEVTKQHVDLAARIKNAQNTEAQLNQILQQRSGQTKDVLEVEKESARVRGEIEQMEAEQKSLEHRVEFATVNLTLNEEYKEQLAVPPLSAATRLHNALVEGYRDATETLLGIALFFAEYTLTLLIWALILGLPAFWLWRRFRRAAAAV